MTKSELLKKIRELHKLQQRFEVVKEKIDGLKDEIKAEMTEQNVQKIQVGEIKVSCTKYVSHRFDTEKFKAQWGYLYTSFLKEIQASRFTLRKKTAKEHLQTLKNCNTYEEIVAKSKIIAKKCLIEVAIKASYKYASANYKKKEIIEALAGFLMAEKHLETVHATKNWNELQEFLAKRTEFELKNLCRKVKINSWDYQSSELAIILFKFFTQKAC